MLLVAGIRFWHPARPALGRTASGALSPPPKENRGVSSQAGREDTRHFVEPIAFTGPVAAAQAKAKASLLELPRTALVAEETGYLRVEQRTALWSFVDDVECVFDAAGVIHVRSMARQGDGDFGVNRKRMEALRARFR